jgi:hypothetical protein
MPNNTATVQDNNATHVIQIRNGSFVTDTPAALDTSTPADTPTPIATPIQPALSIPEPTPAVSASRYTQQVSTVNGLATINTSMKVIPVSINDPLTTDKMQYYTWYGLDTSSAFSNSYGIIVKNVDPVDLQKVDIAIELTNGGVAHVQNLRVSQVNGIWQLEGDYAGIAGIALWDGAANTTPYVYNNVKQPVVMPDFVGQQDFIFMVYVDTSYTGA